jgi:hypothetical protein
MATFANAQTNVSGNINKDSTWTLAKSPYVVTGSFTVNAGFTLRVDSGVTVRFQAGTIMYVSGSLRARQATFTSSKDTSLGNPQKGDWAGISPNNAAAILVLIRVLWNLAAQARHQWSTEAILRQHRWQIVLLSIPTMPESTW